MADCPISQKPKGSILVHTEKKTNVLDKYKETSISGKIKGPILYPKARASLEESRHVAAVTDRSSPNPEDSSARGPIPDKDSGDTSVKKVILCSDCKAVSHRKTICFIANDGRVAACGRGPSEHVPCKHHWCAGHDPDYVPPSSDQGKNFLVSKRHALKAQIASKSRSSKLQSPSSDKKGSRLSCSHSKAFSTSRQIKEHDKAYHNDAHQYTHKSGNASESTRSRIENHKPLESTSHQGHRGTYGCSSKGHGKVCFGTVQEEPERVRLRRQLMQERKQAGEWMMDCKIEDAIQKISPTGEHRVKVLVEAFESIMSNGDGETLEQQWDGDHEQSHSHA